MAKKNQPVPDYAALRVELDDVTAKLEQGDLNIDEAVRCYERGLAIVQLLEVQLQQAENRITELRVSAEAATGQVTA